MRSLAAGGQTSGIKMLEQRWRNTVAMQPDAIALCEATSGRSWSFAQLAAAADAQPMAAGRSVAFPQGIGPEFILELLRAWRSGCVVCPLESGQSAPTVTLPPAGIVHLKLTSGTTGRAKCVAFTAEQLAADADHIVATMGLRPDSPNLGVISLAHSYGFSNLVLPLLLHGIPLILAASPLPVSVTAAATLAEEAAVTLPAVPAMWRAWHDAGAIPSNIRLAISAGAVLPLPLESDVFSRTGIKIHNFLGASECGGIAYDHSAVPREDPTLVGAALVGVELSRSDEGRLEVHGAAVGTGYWPEGSGDLSPGRYLTGDLVDLSPTGEVRLRGRAGDVINVAGRKMMPEAVETVLRQHAGVRECLVFGLPAESARGDVIVAVVSGAPDVDESSLRNFLLERLPAWQVPKLWRLESALTASARGKLSRAEWRRRLGAEVNSPPA